LGKPLSIEAKQPGLALSHRPSFWHTDCGTSELDGVMETNPHSAYETVRGELETTVSTTVFVAPFLILTNFPREIPNCIAENRRSVNASVQ